MDEIAEIRLDPETVLTFLEEDSKILQLPTLSDLFPTESDVATNTPAVPYKSQKGSTKLLYQHHTYTKKRTMKSSSTWRQISWHGPRQRCTVCKTVCPRSRKSESQTPEHDKLPKRHPV